MMRESSLKLNEHQPHNVNTDSTRTKMSCDIQVSRPSLSIADNVPNQPGLFSGSTDVSFTELEKISQSHRSRISRYFTADIDTRWTDVLLIICSFVSGLIDGLSFNAWGSFASMQTGNTLFIALGISGQPAYPAYLWAKSLVSVTAFILSNLFFAFMTRSLGSKRRTTYIVSFSLQSTALFAAAIILQLDTVSPKPEDPHAPIAWIQVLPISLFAFQAAGQICASRTLEYDEIPTVVLTTLLCDLLVDRRLWMRDNPKRNRRAGAFVALFLGAMTAGGLAKVSAMSSSLWFAFALKGAITISWFFWRTTRGDIHSQGEGNEEDGAV